MDCSSSRLNGLRKHSIAFFASRLLDLSPAFYETFRSRLISIISFLGREGVSHLLDTLKEQEQETSIELLG